jgi:hypothetical protein
MAHLDVQVYAGPSLVLESRSTILIKFYLKFRYTMWSYVRLSSGQA